MYSSNSLPTLQETIEAFGLRAKKSFGQHFLLDERLLDKIVSYAGPLAGKQVLEVGPGPGGLTRAILRANPAHLTAVEKDSRCIEALQGLCDAYPAQLTIHDKDALKISVPETISTPRVIIANLPYNVGTPLLVNWLNDIAAHGAGVYDTLLLMFQKEVVDRLCATPRSKDYGRLSILTQWLCRVEPVLDIPPGAFSPPPKVMSTVVRITPLAQPLFPAQKETLEKITHIAFQQRRKMLRVSLKPITPEAEAWCVRAGVDPTLRADQVSIEQYCMLANGVAA